MGIHAAPSPQKATGFYYPRWANGSGRGRFQTSRPLAGEEASSRPIGISSLACRR